MTTEWIVFGVVGLLIGSFVNVVIHRLPTMVMQEIPAPHTLYNLSTPASHCPHCQTHLCWFHNIPLFSFMVLRGRCAYCHAVIAWRYPLVELSVALIWLLSATHWTTPESAACWALLGTGLLCLAVIDWDTTLLPDAITQPLLWFGLFASLNGWIDTPLPQAVTGAMVGYLSLWGVANAFEKLTHKEGMGAGDFKLLAAIGAWLGPWLLWPVVLIASVAGIVVGLTLRSRDNLREGGYIPFGPFLASAAAATAWYAPQLLSLLVVA